MKHLTIPCVLFIMSVSLPGLKGQKLTVGAGSGINFSDIHNVEASGSWKSKPGPSAGFFVRWSLTPVLGLQTGLDYSAVYYEHHPYVTDPGPIFYPMSYSSIYPDPGFIMIPVIENFNHSFVSVPLQVTVTLTSVPSMTLGAGMFWTSVIDQDWNYSYILEDFESDTDYGYVFSLSLDYPVTERMNFFTRGKYLTGRKLFLGGRDYRHGYSDLIAGLSFRLGGGGDDEAPVEGSGEELNEDIRLSWFAGAAVSWNSGNVENAGYTTYAGPSAGFSVGFRLGDSKTRFSTGLTLERVGYSMRDSSDSYYRYAGSNEPYYFVDTRTSSDYAVIPALLSFSIGEKDFLNLSTGPWFAARLNSQCRGLAVNETETDGYFRRTEVTVNDDITEFTRRNDFGWMIGADLSVPLRNRAEFYLGLKFRQGIPETMNLENAGISEDTIGKQIFMRNSVVSLHAGLTVPVFKTVR
ncbi:MAG: outer membrane beta-barrel protein [Bacteroidales bacterium]